MMGGGTLGRVHSIQSMGTLDGPGVRFVVFSQGCPLRCGCCHNPDTWECTDGKEYSAEELVLRAVRFKEYFGKDGGITVSGGEPLIQAEFVQTLFALAHEQGINTCLDTSGCLLCDKVKSMLCECDRVLLDIKYSTDEAYREHVGCSIDAPLIFLDYLDKQGIPTTLRRVIIPTLNDTEEETLWLKDLARSHPNVDKIELLPFRKICQVKYDNMGIEFPFSHIPEPTKEQMSRLDMLMIKGR
jgi:pyruvate formate lyase activating enzyme